MSARDIHARFSLAVTLAIGLAATTPAFAQKTFDGAWSVLVVTTSGSCEQYRYAVKVAGGVISYAGQEGGFSVAGGVKANGAVAATLTAGSQTLEARGRLTGTRGAGTWKAPARGCAGRWEADKRG